MVAKKNAVALKKVNVDSTIDMRINKSDIIELMMEEEEARLEKLLNAATENLEKVRETLHQRAFEGFKQDNAEFVNAMEAKYNKTFYLNYREHCDEFRIFMVIAGDGCASDLSISLRLNQDDIKEIQRAESNVQETRNAFRNFRHDGKKTKCAFVRKMLEMSEDGQDLLQKLKDIKVSLPASK